jgi:hypothetical protein
MTHLGIAHGAAPLETNLELFFPCDRASAGEELPVYSEEKFRCVIVVVGLTMGFFLAQQGPFSPLVSYQVIPSKNKK